MKIILGLLAFVVQVLVPVLREMKERSREAIEVVPDPALDELDSYEWVS
jgi:hypothetical protein